MTNFDQTLHQALAEIRASIDALKAQMTVGKGYMCTLVVDVSFWCLKEVLNSFLQMIWKPGIDNLQWHVDSFKSGQGYQSCNLEAKVVLEDRAVSYKKYKWLAENEQIPESMIMPGGVNSFAFLCYLSTGEAWKWVKDHYNTTVDLKEQQYEGELKLGVFTQLLEYQKNLGAVWIAQGSIGVKMEVGLRYILSLIAYSQNSCFEELLKLFLQMIWNPGISIIQVRYEFLEARHEVQVYNLGDKIALEYRKRLCCEGISESANEMSTGDSSRNIGARQVKYIHTGVDMQGIETHQLVQLLIADDKKWGSKESFWQQLQEKNEDENGTTWAYDKDKFLQKVTSSSSPLKVFVITDSLLVNYKFRKRQEVAATEHNGGLFVIKFVSCCQEGKMVIILEHTMMIKIYEQFGSMIGESSSGDVAEVFGPFQLTFFITGWWKCYSWVDGDCLCCGFLARKVHEVHLEGLNSGGQILRSKLEDKLYLRRMGCQDPEANSRAELSFYVINEAVPFWVHQYDAVFYGWKLESLGIVVFFLSSLYSGPKRVRFKRSSWHLEMESVLATCGRV